MAPALLGRVGTSCLDHSSTRPQSGRCLLPRRDVNHRSTGSSPALLVRAEPMVCSSSRPPAGPSTILCSSLRKERKKLAKVLKSHRKVLERRLSALTAAEVDAPVLSELLTELRTLTCRLDEQRAAALLRGGDGSDSSDSDDDDCPARLACSPAVHGNCGASQQQQQQQQRALEPSPETQAPRVPSRASTLVVSGISGQLELQVPEPQEGWDWSEEEFRAATFGGTGGRVMVCTGSKCQRKGATEVLRAVSALSEGNPGIEVVPCKCLGKCSAGAAVRVRPQGQACATYTHVRPAQLRDVFQEHFQEGERVTERVAAPAVPLVCCAECTRQH